MKNYLVTGAAGFIGAELAQNLIDSGNNVVTIDNLSTGFRYNIPEQAIFIEGDCQSLVVIERLKEYHFEAIFHLAGQSSGEVSFDDPVYDLQTNTQSTILLLQYALNSGCKKFIYASSMSVYGDHPKSAIEETVVPSPKSFYGIGKLASEHYLRIYSDLGLNCAALRLFNVYGPGQNMENLRQGMVSIFLSQALANGNILVKGGKRRFRDFIYIDDVVQAFVNADQMNSIKGYSCLNICYEQPIFVEELIEIIKSNFEYDITVQYQGSTQGDQIGIFGSNKKAKKILNWSPETNLEVGFRAMCSWAKMK